MLKLFLEIWYSLPMGWRYLLMAVPVAVSIIAFFVTLDWWTLAPGSAVSLMLFLLPGPSESEKKGYHF